MGKLINEFDAETIPQSDDNLLLAKPDNVTKSMSLATARGFFVAELVLIPQKLTDFQFETKAEFTAIAAINAAQDAAVEDIRDEIAGKSNIGHSHDAADITDFASAVASLSAVTVQDEATPLGNARAFNFVGAGVTASLTGDTATILVSGLGGGGSSDVWDTIDMSSWDALY
ncbi:MAG: hypothetical protein HC935_10635 [Pseudanabaena sp. SU_2_4]|nr:hypothetical protein [Pseudanabaena sp. SU_2_4]